MKKIDGQVFYLALKDHPARKNVVTAAKELTTQRLVDSMLQSRAGIVSDQSKSISITSFLEVEVGGEKLVKMPSRRESIEVGLRACGVDPDVELPVDVVVRLLEEYREALKVVSGV